MINKIGRKYPDNWGEIRKKVLKRDGYKCCNDLGHRNTKLHVHHIVPISRGGTHQLSNLKTICEECHAKLHPHMEEKVRVERKDGEESISLDIDISTDFILRDDVMQTFTARIMESPIDVREQLKDYVYKSDEFQQKVIDAEESTIRILAPAGSGKTQTVINRVISNIRKGLNPNRILVLTFDNSAVNSIHEKLGTQLDEIGVDVSPPEIKTLNAYGFSLLREYFPEEFKRIISSYRERRLFKEIKEGLLDKRKDIFDALPPNVNSNYYVEFFSLLKNEIIDPRAPNTQIIADFMLQREEATPFFPDPSNKSLVTKTIQAVIWLFMAYESVMQRECVIDFDDQKLRPYILMPQNPTILDVIQGKYSEIIVDEFQDINKLDFEFIKLIAKHTRLVVTGDDDQAIYGFRGCTPEYILDLEMNLDREVKTYKLRKNYRSPQNIVHHATSLIQHNNWREEKDPIPAITKLAEIKIVSTLSAGLEAKFVVEYLKEVKKMNPGISFGDCAILYRTNAQSLPLQVEFILNDMPYYVRDEDNILTNETLEKLLGFLRMKIAVVEYNTPQPEDAVLAVRSYFRYVNANQRAQLLDYFSKQSNFLHAINSEAFYHIIKKARRSQISEKVKKAISAKTLMDTLDVLATFNGLRGMIGSLEDVISEQVPLGEIYELAANFRGNTEEFISTIDKTIEEARLTDAGKNKDNGVGLLTYFRSKGLQWHTVVLTTCNNGIIPHKKAPIEDERRLFYVAMTRAESNLLVSYVNNVCGSSVKPSRFISEAGLTLT